MQENAKKKYTSGFIPPRSHETLILLHERERILVEKDTAMINFKSALKKVNEINHQLVALGEENFMYFNPDLNGMVLPKMSVIKVRQQKPKINKVAAVPKTIHDKGFVGVIKSIKPLGPVKVPKPIGRPKKIRVDEPKESKPVGRPRSVKPTVPLDLIKVAEFASKINEPKKIMPAYVKRNVIPDKPKEFIRPKAEYTNIPTPYGIATEMLREQLKTG